MGAGAEQSRAEREGRTPRSARPTLEDGGAGGEVTAAPDRLTPDSDEGSASDDEVLLVLNHTLLSCISLHGHHMYCNAERCSAYVMAEQLAHFAFPVHSHCKPEPMIVVLCQVKLLWCTGGRGGRLG